MYNIPIHVNYQGILLKGYASPITSSEDNTPSLLQIQIQGWCIGVLRREKKKWVMDRPIDPKFIEILGNYIGRYIRGQRC